MELSSYSSSGQSPLYFIQLINRTPAFSNKTSLSYVQIEHVHGVVYGFDFLDLQMINIGHISTR